MLLLKTTTTKKNKSVISISLFWFGCSREIGIYQTLYFGMFYSLIGFVFHHYEWRYFEINTQTNEESKTYCIYSYDPAAQTMNVMNESKDINYISCNYI